MEARELIVGLCKEAGDRGSEPELVEEWEGKPWMLLQASCRERGRGRCRDPQQYPKMHGVD